MNNYRKLRWIMHIVHAMIGLGILIAVWTVGKNVETHATISTIAIGYAVSVFIIMGLGRSLKRKENNT